MGLTSKRRVAKEQQADEDAADVAYTRRVLNVPDAEWIGWDDIKRELADKGD